MLFIFLLFLPLPLLGYTLYFAAKSGDVPPWLKWWSPMTKKLLSYSIDERYSKSERILIDGIVLIVFGSFLMIWFLLIYFFYVVLKIAKEEIIWIVALLILAFARKIIEKVSLMILKKRKVMRG